VNSSLRRVFILSCALLTTAKPSHAQTSNPSNLQTGSTSTHQASVKSSQKNGAHRKSRKRAHRGQQKIDSQRAQQIQAALIREHYLSGKPSGVWDHATQTAMQKYQANNGWQTKTTPDSRALIKLGLGPDHEHLLNPDSAMTTQPQQHDVPVSSSSPNPNSSSTPMPQN